MPSVIAIVKNWRRYGLPHVSCGFVEESDFGCFGVASLCFGDGSAIEVLDRSDQIITEIPWNAVEE